MEPETLSTRGTYNFSLPGDGAFTDVTEQSGARDLPWGASASILDYDRDGWLDLYVANHIHFDIMANKKCYSKNSRRDYCGPVFSSDAKESGSRLRSILFGA